MATRSAQRSRARSGVRICDNPLMAIPISLALADARSYSARFIMKFCQHCGVSEATSFVLGGCE